MANIGDFGFFGFQDGQDVAARRCVVTGYTPGSAYGPGEPDRYKVLVFVSSLDDAFLDPNTEQLALQPTAGGLPIPRFPVERECLGQSQAPTAGGFWIP